MKTKNLIYASTTLLLLLVFTISFSQELPKKDVIKIKTSSQCSMCKDRLEGVLAFEKGIISSDLNVDTKILTVTYKPAKISPAKIREIVSKTGYDADSIPADKQAYSKLPACCKVPGKP